jgi:hypothetical protein
MVIPYYHIILIDATVVECQVEVLVILGFQFGKNVRIHNRDDMITTSLPIVTSNCQQINPGNQVHTHIST